MATWTIAAVVFGMSILTGMSAGATGFGTAIIFQMLWALLKAFGVDGAGDLIVAAAVLTVQVFFLSSVVVYMSYRSVRWDFLFGFLPLYYACVPMGGIFLVSVDAHTLEKILALLFYFVALQLFGRMLYADYQSVLAEADEPDGDREEDFANHADDSIEFVSIHAETSSKRDSDARDMSATEHDSVANDEYEEAENAPIAAENSGDDTITHDSLKSDATPLSNWTRYGWHPQTWTEGLKIMLVGALAGFLDGSFGTGGPPSMIFYSLHHGYAKDQIRATSRMGALIGAPARIISNTLLGIWQGDDVGLYVATVVGGCMGLAVGHYIHGRVDRELVIKILLSLIFLSTLSLSKVQEGTTFSWVMVAVLAVTACLLCFMQGYVSRLRTRTRALMKEANDSADAADAADGVTHWGEQSSTRHHTSRVVSRDDALNTKSQP